MRVIKAGHDIAHPGKQRRRGRNAGKAAWMLPENRIGINVPEHFGIHFLYRTSLRRDRLLLEMFQCCFLRRAAYRLFFHAVIKCNGLPGKFLYQSTYLCILYFCICLHLQMPP